MATKKKAAKKAARKKAPARAPRMNGLTTHLKQIFAIVNGPNSPRGAHDELESYLILNTDKGLEDVRAIVTSQGTCSEKVEQVKHFLQGKV